jgi:NADP-reducing hydrogenase subunit HndB
MPSIKSLEDLKRIREEALEKRKVKTAEGSIQVTVAMGTCGIAAGARDTMKAILDHIESNNVSGVIVTQTGCVGKCDYEPIVAVTMGEEPKVMYGRITPERAHKIMQEHVAAGKVLTDWVIPA